MEKRLNSDLIRKALKEKHITQFDFAKSLGISQSAISHYLAGRVKPTKEKEQKICKMLDIKPDELFINYNNDEIAESPSSIITDYTARLVNELQYKMDKLKYDDNIKEKIKDIIFSVWGACYADLKEGKKINILCPDAPPEQPEPTRIIINKINK